MNAPREVAVKYLTKYVYPWVFGDDQKPGPVDQQIALEELLQKCFDAGAWKMVDVVRCPHELFPDMYQFPEFDVDPSQPTETLPPEEKK